MYKTLIIQLLNSSILSVDGTETGGFCSNREFPDYITQFLQCRFYAIAAEKAFADRDDRQDHRSRAWRKSRINRHFRSF